MSLKKRYSREEKIAIVELLTKRGRKAPSLANEYGIHENTIYKWTRAYSMNPTRRLSRQRERGAGRGGASEAADRGAGGREYLSKKVSAYFAKSQR